jgi:SAM-dependent methyltransferase
VCAGDVRRLPHADATVDHVLSNSTLDHLESLDEVARALGEIHRVLRPGGTLVLTMDNFANPIVALRNRLPYPILSGLRVVPYRMGATCGPRRLRAMLAAAGFDVLVMRSLMHVPRLPAVLAAAGVDAIGGPRSLAGVFSTLCRSFEWMDALPTRYVTGYFIAVRARKPERAASTR